MLDEQGKLPKSLLRSDFLEMNKSFQYFYFWYQLYPKSQTNSKMVTGSFMFPELRTDASQEQIKLANSFELFLMQRQKFHECQSWFELISANITMLLTGELDYLQSHPAIQIDHGLKQLICFRSFEEGILESFSQKLVDWENRWDKVMKMAPVTFDMKVFSKASESVRNCLLKGMRMIQSSGKVDWTRKCALILKAMTLLELLSRRPEFGSHFLCSVIRDFSPKDWIVPFLLFNGAVADGTVVLSQTEQSNWLKFESCILELLQSDAESLELFASQKRQLCLQFGNLKRKGKLVAIHQVRN